MQTLKRIGLFVLLLIILLVIISLFLPGKVHVERTAVINAEPSVIYDQVNGLKNWPNWAPWFKLDPNMQVMYDGPESGTGASYSWRGNKKVGEGKLTITESHPAEHVGMRMDFKGQGSATADFNFERADGGTKVTWGMNSDMGMNPIGKYLGLFMDQMVGGDFEKGLESLKKISESSSSPAAPMNTMPADSTKSMTDSTLKPA